MKNQNVLLAAALLVLGAASCQKEEKVVTQFTAGMEQSSAKTYLGDDSYFYWESTDKVRVYSDGATNGADFDVAPRSGNGTWAVLSGSIAAGGSYTAIYPAGIAATASSVMLPAEQASADGSLAGFPMYAESSTDEFQFKNLCGALRIHLEQANCTISRIELTAASAINGIYDIYDTTGIPMLAHHDGSGTNTVTLTLGTAQPIADGHDFYIYLPAGTYSNMQLTFYQPDGSCCTKSGNVTVERSVCTPVAINGGLVFSIPEGALPGGFSVSAAKQVRFAKGNLQNINGVWRFAEHQYDCLGTYSADAWDLFGWSTNNAATSFGMSTSTEFSDYHGSFVDWGTAFGSDSPWKTLSSAEWEYVLYGREGADIRRGKATVAGKRGLILLPDTWTTPSGLNFANGGASGWTTNEYESDEWVRMEAAGAVFLPAAGYRDGADVYMLSFNDEPIGNYWSSTLDPDGDDYAYGVDFDGNIGSASRLYGLSVRLVQDY